MRDVHHTHAWTLDGEHHVLTTHLVMESDSSREQILEARKAVRQRLDSHEFEHITLDIELDGEECAAIGDRTREDKTKEQNNQE